ncbi:MAG: hypothetical protein V5A72_02155 [Candidatus Nanohaloarchaea archaeon]
MILERMIKEEWRTQSKMYKGRNLALLPFTIFLLTYLGSRMVTEFSSAPETDIGLLISAFGFFTGLAAGSIGFSSSDAAKNVLGDTNFIIFSSRTLPVRKSRLLASFLVKDLVFYTGLYLLPVSLAAILVSPGLAIYAGYMSALFLIGLSISLIVANTALKIPSTVKVLTYENIPATPVSKKSILDVSRSSGGLFKIIMSMGILLGLYGYIVNYVPVASYLLQNPLLSFSVILGMMSVTVYNWLNTYDDYKDYSYLPLDQNNLLKSKFQAFKAIIFVLLVPVIVGAYLLYGGQILLAAVLAYTTAYYVGSATMYEAGLDPNEKMIDAVTFTKFLIVVNILVMPLLALTSFNVGPEVILSVVVPMLVIGKVMEEKAYLNYS